MNKPNIIMLIPELTMGGAQHSFARLAWALSTDYNIFPIVFDEGSKPFYPMPAEVINLGTKPSNSFISKIINATKRFIKLRRFKKSIQPTACISFLEGADYLNVLTKQKEKVIISIRGSKVHDPNMQAYMFALRSKLLIPFLYKRADQIVTVNKGIQNELVNYFNLDVNKIKTIYNYIDNIDNSSNQNHSLPQVPFILYSGRLAPEKGIIGIVKVFASITKEIKDIKLVLLGDGPEKNNIMQCAQTYKLTVGKEIDNQIMLVGNIQNTNTYLKNASVTVLNSVSEGFPNAMAESLLAGKLVVVGDCPYGPRELFEMGEGESLNGKPFPIKTGGGILLPLIDETSLQLWIESICNIVSEKKVCSELFINRFNKATSKNLFISSWKQVIEY